MKNFKEILPTTLDQNIFDLIGKNWMLITTADKDGKANAMTASWGGMGVLWHKQVCTIYIRPQRYTHALLEDTDNLSLCFPPEQYREALKLCGSQSGKEQDKIAKAGLTVGVVDNTPYICESDVVIVCKKIYKDSLKAECFLDKSDLKHYPNGDFHDVYICQIEKVLIKGDN